MDNKEITIQGVLVSISQPYEAGHKITEAEAKALNQVRAENIGNNKRNEIKKMLEGGAKPVDIQADVQKMIATYDAEYEFTLASVGGRSASLDPLTKECRALARSYITGELKKMGTTQKAYIEAHGKDVFESKVIELADNAQIVALAKKNLEQRAKMSDINLNIEDVKAA